MAGHAKTAAIVNGDGEAVAKECSRCHEIVPIDGFTTSKSGRFGRDPRCRACHREAARRYYHANRESLLEKGRERYANNPEYLADWRDKNPEAYQAYQWRGGYRARAKRYGFEPVIEEFGRADVVAMYGDRCWHCKAAPFEHLDHHPRPVAEGGPHTLENVKPSCGPCNRAQSAGIRKRRAALDSSGSMD